MCCPQMVPAAHATQNRTTRKPGGGTANLAPKATFVVTAIPSDAGDADTIQLQVRMRGDDFRTCGEQLRLCPHLTA